MFSGSLPRLVHAHRLAVVLFPLLAALFLYDVLFLDKSLSAFDIALRHQSWLPEFDYQGVHNLILSDSPYGHYPERQFNWRLMRAGHNPDFNPYTFSGAPFIAQGIGAFITSLPQLFLPTPAAIDWSTWLRLALAGLFMYALLVGLGVSRTAALVGGVVWTYNLHQIVWLEFPQHLATQLWMPILLLLNHLVLKHGFRRDHVLFLFVVNLFFFTSGYTQIVLYTYIAIGLFNTVYVLCDGERTVSSRLRRWFAIHLIYAALAIVVLPSVLQEAHEISTGLRGTQDFRLAKAEPVAGLAAVLELLRSVAPDLNTLKRFYSPSYLGGENGEPWRTTVFGNAVEGGAYYGIVPFFLAAFSVFYGLRRPERRLYLALATVLVFFVALSVRDTLVVWLLNLIPLAGFGSTGRGITIIVFVASVFAAFGLSRFTEMLRDGKRLWPLTALALFAALPVVVDSFYPALALRHFVYPMLLLAAVAGAAWFSKQLDRVEFVGAVVLVLVVIDLGYASYGFNTRLDNDRVFPTNKTLRYLLDDKETFRTAVLAETPLYHPNVLTYYGLATVGGYSTVAPMRYLDFIKHAYGESHVTLNGILFLFFGNLDVLRLLGVKYVISDRELDSDVVDEAVRFDGQFIYRVRDHLSRAYCASDAFVEADERRLLETFGALARDFDRPVVTDAPTGLQGALTEKCEIDALSVFTDRLQMRAATDADTLVVLPYNFSPHWHLTIDGLPATLVRANHTFMAFRLPPGEHRVVAYHRNGRLVAAAVTQILFALLLAAVVIWGRIAGPARALLLILALVIAAKNSFSLPGVRNESVPERMACETSLFPNCLV